MKKNITRFSIAAGFHHLLILSLCINIFTFVSGDLVGDICGKSRNPTFCLNFFKSDHSANLIKLGLKSIDRAKSSAGNTKKILDSLVKGTRNPSMKEKYETCLENYGDAIYNLEEAGKSINDPGSMNIKVSAAMTYVDTCEEGFGEKPINPSSLRNGNDFLTNACSIALVISNRL